MNNMMEAIKGAATSAIDALKTNPLVLAMLILNAFIFTLIYYGGREIRSHQAEQTNHLNEQMKLILDRCLPKG